MSYHVIDNAFRVHSTHSTLEAAGKAMIRQNKGAHYTQLVGVRHVPAAGMPSLGDVSGLALAAALGPPKSPAGVRRDLPKPPRRLERRKHGKGDAADEIIRSLRRHRVRGI